MMRVIEEILIYMEKEGRGRKKTGNVWTELGSAPRPPKKVTPLCYFLFPVATHTMGVPSSILHLFLCFLSFSSFLLLFGELIVESV